MEKNKVTAGTISRTIILILALVNQLLTAKGYSIIPIDDNTIAELVSWGFTAAAALVAWWKNNSFTKQAIAADKTMQMLKEETKKQYN